MKKKLQLGTVINIKADLERDISELQKDVIKYAKTEKKIDTLLSTMDKKEAQLIVIKEAVQKANRDKHKDGKTNNWHIYRLSVLKANKSMLEDLIQGHDEKLSQISKDKLNEDLKNNLQESNTIRSALSVFNRDHNITVELDESLNLLSET